MNIQPTAREVVMSPGWDALATRVSKTYITLFFIYCVVIAFLDDTHFGLLLWAAFLLFGLFASSLLFAMPMTALKLFLGTKVGISPLRVRGRVFYLSLDYLGYALLFVATRYAINLLDHW